MFPPSLDLAELDGINGFVLNGIDPDDRSGFSVSYAGDVNADGLSDIVIGAPQRPAAFDRDPGESYVVFGSEQGFGATLELANLDGSNGFVIRGQDFGFMSRFGGSGWSVADAGDINGDGIDDLIIGAPLAGGTGSSYVVFGSTTDFPAELSLGALDGTNGFRLVGIDPRDDSGWSVAGAGDVNSDGIEDLIIGAPFAANLAGESFVVFGSASGFPASFGLAGLDGSNGFRLDGTGRSGFSVAGAGDVNDDGIDDVIVGAPRENMASGNSYVVFGSSTSFPASLSLATLDGSNGFRLEGVDAGDESGFSVAGAGDVNGDLIDDLIIGASFANNFGGESYVVFGSAFGFTESFDLARLDGNNGFRLDGISRSGFSVAGAGDVNADGVDDIIIGAPDEDLESGNSYIVFGSLAESPSNLFIGNLDGANGFRADGILGGSRGYTSGRSVSSAGDINGDGIDDILIGAPIADEAAGESYVIFGKKFPEECVVIDAKPAAENFSFTGGQLQINNFDTNAGGENTSDTLDINAAGFRTSINTVEDLFDFIRFIEFDGDGSTDTIYTATDIAFVLSRNGNGTVKDGVVLTGMIGEDGITIEALAGARADVFGKFPDKEDDFFCAFSADADGLAAF